MDGWMDGWMDGETRESDGVRGEESYILVPLG